MNKIFNSPQSIFLNRLLLIVFCSICSAYGYDRQEFAVAEVGLSLNTETIFIVTTEEPTRAVCSTDNYFRVELERPEAYLFYSAALNAMNNDKKVRIQYTPGDCIHGSEAIEVLWNLNY